MLTSVIRWGFLPNHSDGKAAWIIRFTVKLRTGLSQQLKGNLLEVEVFAEAAALPINICTRASGRVKGEV